MCQRAHSPEYINFSRSWRAIFSISLKFGARGTTQHLIWSRQGSNQANSGNPLHSPNPIKSWPSLLGWSWLVWLPSPRSGLPRLACTTQQRHRPPSAAGAALGAAIIVAGHHHPPIIPLNIIADCAGHRARASCPLRSIPCEIYRVDGIDAIAKLRRCGRNPEFGR